MANTDNFDYFAAGRNAGHRAWDAASDKIGWGAEHLRNFADAAKDKIGYAAKEARGFGSAAKDFATSVPHDLYSKAVEVKLPSMGMGVDSE